MLRFRWAICALVVVSAYFNPVARAADEAVYFLLDVDELRPYVPAGALDAAANAADVAPAKRALFSPRIVVDGPGEAYWLTSSGDRFERSASNVNRWGQIVARLPKPGDFAGTLYYPNPTYTAFRSAPIKIPAAKSVADVATRNAFYTAKRLYYERLMQEGLPGGAWFRHQVREADLAVNGATTQALNPAIRAPYESFLGFDDTYTLAGENRTANENLRLYRMLSESRADDAVVRLDTIRGISTREIDWKPHLKDKNPVLDATASYVPADQHVVFFPTIEALIRLADEADRLGTPLLQLAELQSQDAKIFDRYRRQLGLRTTTVDRLLGREAIKSLALTGGDLDFRLGTDVAILFEAGDPATLRTMLGGQITLNTAGEREVKHESGEMLGVPYESWRNDDRTVSSYLATLDEVLMVTNSPVQLRNVIEAHQKKRPSIAGLDAYRFYRDRYRPGDAEETALLFLSDATSRRWSGPRWRIADARRVRDEVVLSELQATNLPALVTRTVEPKSLRTDLRLSTAGDVRLTAAGVRSTVVGSPAFMTPIGELEFDQVTKLEADAYGKWRDRDEQDANPIALRFHVAEDRSAVDVTVKLLFDAEDGEEEEFEEVLALFKGAKLKPTSGDPHGAVFHGAVAFDHEAVRRIVLGVFGFGQVNVDPFGWLGESIAVYADDSPFWEEFAKLKTDEEREEFTRVNVRRLPVAVNIEVASAFQATAFLAAVRGLIHQTAPGMTAWETHDHGEQSYVKIRITEQAEQPGQAAAPTAVYYALTADSLTVSPSEDLIKGALDRNAGRAGRAKGEQIPAAEKVPAKPGGETGLVESSEWLGETLGFELGERAIRELVALAEREHRPELRKLSWANLPALNEWKRLFPDQDPVAVHERLWGAKLVCPGGGRYVWNETWRTMESTEYGHPGEPKEGGETLPQFREFRGARFGLTLEDQGLRVRAELTRGK